MSMVESIDEFLVYIGILAAPYLGFPYCSVIECPFYMNHLENLELHLAA